MITKNYSDYILSDEIKYCFINILIYFLEKLVTVKQKNYKIRDKEDIDFKFLDMLVFFKDVIIYLLNCKADEDKLKDLIVKHENYKDYLIEKLTSILSKKNLITNFEYSYLFIFSDDIKFILKMNESKNKKIEELPDEFLDPIMNTLIENPVMLPNNIIIDKETINRHLITSETNPFNREKLNQEILEEYNNKKEVIDKINEFKYKLNLYLSSEWV